MSARRIVQIAATEMDAGRDMDALIAKNVFAWLPLPPLNYPNRMWAPRTTRCWRAPNEHHARALPRFSTEIGAAWSVVERLARKGFDVDTRSYGTRGCAAVVTPLETSIGGGSDSWTGQADDMPLAICRAALQAVGCRP